MKQILVIDDSDVNLLLIEAIFEKNPKVQILLENNSTNTYAQLRKRKPDILILDLMMPKLNGLQILCKIKSEPELKQIPVLIITASNDTALINKAIRCGADDYIKKPIDVIEVERKINKILQTQ